MEQFPRPPDGDQNRGPLLVKVDIIFTTAAVLTTALRISARLCSHLKVGWDDYLIVLSTVLTVSSMAMVIKEVESGFGRHGYFLSPQQLFFSSLWSDIGIIICFAANFFAKVSICAFLLRIQDGKRWKWVLWFLIAGSILTAGPNIIVLLARCQPFDAVWTGPGRGKCWSINVENGFGYLQLSYAIIQDIACSAMPIAVVWNLHMKRRLKLAICSLTGLGLITTATAIARAVLLPEMNDPDHTWILVDISIYFRLEVNLAIIAANMALSRLIYRFLRDQIQHATASSTVQGGDTTSSKRTPRKSTNLHPEVGDYDNIPLNEPGRNQITKTTDLYVSAPTKPSPVYANDPLGQPAGIEGAHWV